MCKLVEVSIVARRLSVSERTVIRMLSNPDVPLRGVRLNRRAIRVLESTILPTIEKRLIEQEECGMG